MLRRSSDLLVLEGKYCFGRVINANILVILSPCYLIQKNLNFKRFLFLYIAFICMKQ